MLYLVALTAPSRTAWKKLEQLYPTRHHVVSGTMAFVAPDGISAVSDLGRKLGIAIGDSDPTGLVVKINDPDLYWGVLPTSAIDWLKAARS